MTDSLNAVRSARSSSRSGKVVCLLGAGRSGTTLLYKLLAMHRDVGFLSNYQAKFPSWPQVGLLQRLVRDAHHRKLASWFSSEGGAYFNTKQRRWIQALLPTPSECEEVFTSCGVPEYPLNSMTDVDACKRLGRFFEAARLSQGTPLLLTKRTANNRRIHWLEEAFDEPKYLHIVRDGRAVTKSLLEVNWWGSNVLSWRGQTVADLVSAGEDELELAAQCWIRELDNIEHGLRSVRGDRVLTLRYEDLLADYRSSMSRILAFMGLDVSSDAEFWSSLEQLGLRAPGANWGERWTPDQAKRVLETQEVHLKRWGYM